MNDGSELKSYSKQKKKSVEIEKMLESDVPLSVIAKTMNIRISDILEHQERCHDSKK